MVFKKLYRDEDHYKKIKAMKKSIKKYKVYRFLWDTTHPKYYCQKWRAAAWEEVINVWREYKIDICPKYVKNRISHMRSNYTRQKKKVDSLWLEHGVRYKPRLWYYDLISFVGDPFKTSHADDIDDKEFARALEEKQKRKSTAPARSTGSVATNLQDTFYIGYGYIFTQYHRMEPLVSFLPLETFLPLENYYFAIDTTILQLEPDLESSSPCLGITMSENNNQRFHESYLINYEEDMENPKSFFDFTLDKRDYDDILTGLSSNSYECKY